MTITYPDINREQFMERLKPYFTVSEMNDIEAAYFFCKYAHRGQKRDDGRRYFDHPRAVAWILIDELGIDDADAVIIALLHDLQEDSFIMTEARIEINFGRTVALGVRNMSKNTTAKDNYWPRFITFAQWRELVCKLADRLHNLRTLSVCTVEKQRRKLLETESVIYPLFDRASDLTPSQYQPALQNLCKMIVQQVDLQKAQLDM